MINSPMLSVPSEVGLPVLEAERRDSESFLASCLILLLSLSHWGLAGMCPGVGPRHETFPGVARMLFISVGLGKPNLCGALVLTD